MIFQTHNVFAYVLPSSLSVLFLPHKCMHVNTLSSLSLCTPRSPTWQPSHLVALLSEVIRCKVNFLSLPTLSSLARGVHRGNRLLLCAAALSQTNIYCCILHFIICLHIWLSTRLWSLSQVIDLRKHFYEVFDPLTPPYNDFLFLGNRYHQ